MTDTKKKSLIRIVRSEFSTLVKLNLLFICASIPIITIGPALITLFEMVGKLEREEITDLWIESKEAFCRHFKTGVLLEGLALFLWFIWTFPMNFYLHILTDHLFYGILLFGALIVGLLLSSVCMYVLALLGKEKLGACGAIRFALLLTIARPGRGVLSALVVLSVWMVCYMLALRSVPLIVVIACSGTALCVIKIIDKPINQFVLKKTEGSEKESD